MAKKKKTPRLRESAEPKPAVSRYWIWAALAVILTYTVAMRIHLLHVPLERDEGEFAYMGQLMLHGIPPYGIAANMKLPGVYTAYALIMGVFGQTTTGVHLGGLVVNVVNLLLIFVLGKRLMNEWAGVAAAAAYAVMSVSPVYLGFAAHSEHFVDLFYVVGLIAVLKAIDSRKLLDFLFGGLLFGVAFLMKQPALILAAFAGLYIIWTEIRSRPGSMKGSAVRVSIYAAGVIVPFLITCLWLRIAGVFDRFWFWTFQYARQYTNELTLAQGFEVFKRMSAKTLAPHSWLWILSAVGITSLIWDKRLRPKGVFMVGLLVFSFLAVCPGYYFREHYFLLMLPPVTMFIGAALTSGENLLKRKLGSHWYMIIPVAVLMLALWHSISFEMAPLFQESPTQFSRRVYKTDPFPEAKPVADYIRSHTNENDKIFVLGSEPEIYFYSHRKSATEFIYMYGLGEQQKFAQQMKTQMFRQVEAAKPKYVVMVSVSWLGTEETVKPIWDWFNQYARDNLEVVAVADVISGDYTEYRWDINNSSPRPKTETYMVVFKRRPDASR